MTIESSDLFETISLPTPPDGWFDEGYSILGDGTLGILRTDVDIHTEHRHWWKLVEGGEEDAPFPDLWRGEARLSTFNGTLESSPISIPSIPYPAFDRFNDGRWVIASSRCKTGEKNGQILDVSGGLLERLELGDAIEHLRCSPDGTIWIGYFDEGIFGNSALAPNGIVQITAEGSLLWSFAKQSGLYVDDCYALTLLGSEAWTCFYSDFPIVRVSSGKAQKWENPVQGAKALATDGTHILLAGGYGDAKNDLNLLELSNQKTRLVATSKFSQKSSTGASLLQGQGDTLHIVSGRIWARASIAKSVEIFQS